MIIFVLFYSSRNLRVSLLSFFPCTYTIKNVIRIKGWQKIPNFAKVIIFISQNFGIFFYVFFLLRNLFFTENVTFSFFAVIECNTKTAFGITMKKFNKFSKKKKMFFNFVRSLVLHVFVFFFVWFCFSSLKQFVFSQNFF